MKSASAASSTDGSGLLSRHGFVFDPSSSINSVDIRPFNQRAFERPRQLRLTQVEASGRLDYPVRHLPDATLRFRPTAK
jgi:hypothetical protein